MIKIEYSRLHHNSDYPAEGGIFAFFSDAGFPKKVISLDKKVISLDKEFDRDGTPPLPPIRFRWIIWSANQGVLYKIRERVDSRKMHLLNKMEIFLENIEKIYPEDLEFFLWHPYFLDLNKESILL